MDKEIVIQVEKKILLKIWIVSFLLVICVFGMTISIRDVVIEKNEWYYYPFGVVLTVYSYITRKNGKKLYKKKNILKINKYGFYGYLEPTIECVLWEEIQKIDFRNNAQFLKGYHVHYCFYMEIILKNGTEKLLPYAIAEMLRTQEIILSNMEKEDVIIAVKENFSDKIHQNNIEFNF